MAWQQLVNPDLDTTGQIGWCLAFVEDAFATPHLSATATDGWNSTEFPHNDRNFPELCVPVWFSYYENGLNFGHVAIYVPGRGVLSSPYKANNSQQWFSGIDECARVLRCTYLGWSEDLATIRIVQYEEDIYVMDEEAAKDLWRGLLHREPENDDVWRGWVGKTFNEAYQAFTTSDEWIEQNQTLKFAYSDAVQQIGLLKAQIAATPTNITVASAIKKAQATAPSATKQPYFVNLVKAIFGKQ